MADSFKNRYYTDMLHQRLVVMQKGYTSAEIRRAQILSLGSWRCAYRYSVFINYLLRTCVIYFYCTYAPCVCISCVGIERVLSHAEPSGRQPSGSISKLKCTLYGGKEGRMPCATSGGVGRDRFLIQSCQKTIAISVGIRIKVCCGLFYGPFFAIRVLRGLVGYAPIVVSTH